MDKREVAELCAYMQGIWGRNLFPLPDTKADWAIKVQAWLDVLGDVPAQAVRSAVASLSDSEFPPALGLIRKTVFQDTGEELVGLPSWDEFWAWVRDIASKSTLFLYDDSPPFECPWPLMEGLVTLEVVCNWARDGLTSHDLEMIVQAHVRRVYEARTDRLDHHGVPDVPALQAWREHLATASLDLRLDRALGEG